jgi:DNA-binding transcriptional LysR family regulator
VDIVEEGIDIALRIGKLDNSSLIAKKIAPINIVIMASPDYLLEHGTPETPQDLPAHRYLKYSYSDDAVVFSRFGKKVQELNFKPRLIANNGDILVEAAACGGGVAIQPTFIAGEALAAGKLVRILNDYDPDPMGLYMVYANRQYLPSKVRSFIDFASDYYGPAPYWDKF